MKKIKSFSMFFESHDNHDLVEPITYQEFEEFGEDFAILKDFDMDKLLEVCKLIYELSSPNYNSKRYDTMLFSYPNGIEFEVGFNNDYEMFISIGEKLNKVQAYRLECGFGYEEALTMFFEVIKDLKV